MRKGFTLVELSIVLVIIGLLTGGILVGRSMIETARISATIRQLQQLDAGVANFTARFRSLPGDSPYMEPPGDNDGQITNYSATLPIFTSITGLANSAVPETVRGSYTTAFYGENSNFFYHLKMGEFILSDLPEPNSDASTGVKIGTHIPATPYKEIGIAVTKGRLYRSVDFINGNMYIIGDPSNTTTASLGFDGMPEDYAGTLSLALDTKMDDGVLYTGNMLSIQLNRACGASSYVGCKIFIGMPKF